MDNSLYIAIYLFNRMTNLLHTAISRCRRVQKAITEEAYTSPTYYITQSHRLRVSRSDMIGSDVSGWFYSEKRMWQTEFTTHEHAPPYLSITLHTEKGVSDITDFLSSVKWYGARENPPSAWYFIQAWIAETGTHLRPESGDMIEYITDMGEFQTVRI